MVEKVIYIFSISFQLAGAIILLFGSLSTKRKAIVKRFIGKGLVSRDNNTGKIEYDSVAFSEEYKNAFLHKSAFVMLAAGYILSIWGDKQNMVNWMAMLFVAIVTTVVIVITIYVAKWLANRFSEKMITNSELIHYGLSPNIENISNEEIDRIFRGTINER